MKDKKDILVGAIGLGAIGKTTYAQKAEPITFHNDDTPKEVVLKITRPPILPEIYISDFKSGRELRRERRFNQRKTKTK